MQIYKVRQCQQLSCCELGLDGEESDGEGGEMREMQKVELTLDLPRAAEQATQASPLSNISPILVFKIILIIIAMIIMIRIRASSSNHVESLPQLVGATRPPPLTLVRITMVTMINGRVLIWQLLLSASFDLFNSQYQFIL